MKYKKFLIIFVLIFAIISSIIAFFIENNKIRSMLCILSLMLVIISSIIRDFYLDSDEIRPLSYYRVIDTLPPMQVV